MIDNKTEKEMNFIMSIITAIRNMKSELNISPKKELNLICRGEHTKTSIINKNKKYLNNLVKAQEVTCSDKINKPEKSSTLVIEGIEIFIPLANLIDVDKEIIRLQDKMKDYEGRMNSVKKKIDNENFMKRATKEIVQHEKQKYLDYKSNYDKLKSNLDNLLT